MADKPPTDEEWDQALTRVGPIAQKLEVSSEEAFLTIVERGLEEIKKEGLKSGPEA